MKHKLLILDLVLLAGVIYCGWLLRNRFDDARARENRILAQRVPQILPPPVTPISSVAPAKAVSYLAVAEKLVFSRDRNPNVILDPVIPPPPKVMPDLPRAHGVMSFGGVPTVMLSEKRGAQQHGYRPGDKIGDFTLLAVNNSHILFEWDGLRVLRKLEDITDKEAPVQQAAAAPAPAAPAAPDKQTTVIEKPAEAGPGADLGNDLKACVQGDKSPSGTVVNGMRKVSSQTPFGTTCRWEPVK